MWRKRPAMPGMARMQDEPLLRERLGICEPQIVEIHSFQQGCTLKQGTSAAFLRGQ